MNLWNFGEKIDNARYTETAFCHLAANDGSLRGEVTPVRLRRAHLSNVTDRKLPQHRVEVVRCYLFASLIYLRLSVMGRRSPSRRCVLDEEIHGNSRPIVSPCFCGLTEDMLSPVNGFCRPIVFEELECRSMRFVFIVASTIFVVM